jgi:putative DNA primase/helicase
MNANEGNAGVGSTGVGNAGAGNARGAAGYLAAIDDAPVVPDDRKLLYEPPNDIGNARRLIARHGHDLICVDDMGWHCWDGMRYQGGKFGEAEALRRAQRSAEAIADEARLIQDELSKIEFQHGADVNEKRTMLFDRAEKHGKFGIASGNSPRLKAALEQAQPDLRLPPIALDPDPRQFNCMNGTLLLQPRLEAGEPARLAPHLRRHKISKLAGVAHDPEAKCPRFLEFLEKVMPDAEVRHFLQVWFGYCLTGEITEQMIVICYGTGANGKSTLLDVIKYVLGEYAVTLPIETFLADDRRRGGDATPDVVRLLSTRLALASEPEASSRLSESRVKTITGGEMITARRLFKDQFEFMPSFKLMISVNRKPTIRGQDEGIWRRIAVVPFIVTIPKEERDRKLTARLREEAAGILNWMFEGFLEWEERGLPTPAAIEAAREEYRAESDPIGEWLRDRTVPEPGASTRAAELHQDYVNWYGRNFGDKSKAANIAIFGRAMGDRGYHKEKIGVYFYRDIRLLPLPAGDEPPPAEEGAYGADERTDDGGAGDGGGR